MKLKKDARLRRSKKSRCKMRELEAVRLSVHRTSQHIYAQIISAEGSTVIACASTLDKEVKAGLTGLSNKAAAEAVGKMVAQRALKAGIKRVAFDRSGFNYHGRIKALADAARAGGLEF
jgi:large subunit ribosomal protein L18